MIRQHVMRYGQPILAAVQTTSLYSFHRPGAWAAHLPVPPAASAGTAGEACAIPSTAADPLERMALTWEVHPSLGRRLKPQTPVFPIKRIRH
jgi:hypothetical protein